MQIQRLIPSTLLPLLCLLSFAWGSPAEAASAEPVIYMFSQENCTHCQSQKAFLESEMPEVELVDLEIRDNPENYEMFNKVAERFELVKGTPITVVGKTIIGGFRDGSRIKTALAESATFLTPEEALTDPCAHVYGGKPVDQAACTEDIGTGINDPEGAGVCEDGTICSPDDPQNTKQILEGIPFVGRFLNSDYSLPAIAAILGVIDGFNPCAMWVLMLFLITLIQIGDRVKMLLVAGTFLLAEAIMYTLILTVWLKTFDFVGYSGIVSAIVGLIAIGAGIFFLYEGVFTDGTCKVTNADQRRKVSQKIQNIAKNPLSWGLFLAILGLAISVNIIEFACSVGIPQSFTLILSQSALSGIQTAGLIALYIAGYMVDDLIVFGIALYSIEKIGITHKFSKATNIIGGVLMLLLGALLLFAPQLLIF